jgi:amino acid transporter
VVISLGAILAIPFEEIIRNKEYALASGANNVLGHWGTELIIAGALLATSSAISGTVFGASRQMAVIAADGYFPGILAKRINDIPVPAIIAMSLLAFVLVLTGNLQEILEFGSITFLLVSLLMAYANHRIRSATGSSGLITLMAVFSLALGALLILYYEASHHLEQLYFILAIYAALSLGPWLYSMHRRQRDGK